MSNNDSELYDLLRYLWYLLILPLFYLMNTFYQFWYDTTDRYVYLDLLKHYASNNHGGYPIHFIVSTLVMVVCVCLILFFNPFNNLYAQNRIHGSARPAKLSDIKKLGLLKNKGTVLCKWNRKPLYVSDPLSILLLAPPGTGKSAGVAIPTLFLNPHSIIALDVKKELFQITSRHRHTFSHVMIFEPTSDTTSCWNPLDKTVLPDDFAEKYVRVQQIAANIFIKSESTSDPYWIDSARELFINVAMGLIERDGGTSIPAVYEATLGEGKASRKDTIADLGEEIDNLYEPVAKKLSAYRHTADQQFSGTLGTFDTGLMGFQDPRVKKAVSRCDIKFDDLRGIDDGSGDLKPVTLYLVIKPIDVERLSPLIRVFFESLSKHLLSTQWDKKREHMITFLLDEFPRLGAMEDIIKMPALSRGQGVNSILIAQDAGQIERVYKKSGREEIMSTTAYKIIPSQNSFESAKLISDSIGDMTIKNASTSHSNADFIRSNISKREQGKKLISPQQIMSLKFGKCFVISQFASETPIKGNLYLWFKDKNLLKIAGALDGDKIFRPEKHLKNIRPTEALPAVLTDDMLPSQEIIDEYYNADVDPVEPDTPPSEPHGHPSVVGHSDADGEADNAGSPSGQTAADSTDNNDPQAASSGILMNRQNRQAADLSPEPVIEDGLFQSSDIDDDTHFQNSFSKAGDEAELAADFIRDANSIS